MQPRPDITEERPLVCLVDDAQWLDRASAQVLGFVARRLVAESVAVKGLAAGDFTVNLCVTPAFGNVPGLARWKDGSGPACVAARSTTVAGHASMTAPSTWATAGRYRSTVPSACASASAAPGPTAVAHRPAEASVSPSNPIRGA